MHAYNNYVHITESSFLYTHQYHSAVHHMCDAYTELGVTSYFVTKLRNILLLK